MVDTMYAGIVGRKMKSKKHHKIPWLRIKKTKFPKPPIRKQMDCHKWASKIEYHRLISGKSDAVLNH